MALSGNTMHMQQALDAIGGESMRAEDLRQIAPTYLEGINLRGTFEFPIARYAHRLLPSTAISLDRPLLRQQAG